MEKKEGVKRVLITSIGGGNTKEKDGVKYLKKYTETVYKINGKESKVTTYMPEVVEKEFDVDKTIIIGSTGTMWDNVYSVYSNIKDETYLKNLRETERTSDSDTDIKDLNIGKLNEELVNKVRGIVIKYGLNREEIFENFDSIIKLEEEFDDEHEYEVILDITHSFRSTAFWMFLVMTYLTDVSNKKIKIIEVTYGMYEAKKEVTDPAPIVLLSSFLEILNWIKGASELKQYGNSYYILNELKDSNDDIPGDIKKELRNFSNAMNMNYVGTLMESIDRLKNLKEQINAISGPAKHIVPEVLMNFIEDFDLKEKDDIKRAYLLQATLAKWHCDQKRYAMAAININEALANYVANSLNLREEDSAKFDPNIEAKNWLRDLYNLDNINDIYRKYAEVYHHTRRIRNEIAHSLGNEVKISDDIKLLEDFSKIIMNLLKDENVIKEAEKGFRLLEKVTTKKTNGNIVAKSDLRLEENKSSILILSTINLEENEKNELQVKWGFQDKNIIYLNNEEIVKWKKANSDRELKYFKDKIISALKEGDYILLHGDYLKMNKMKGYAIDATNPLKQYRTKILIFSDRVSPKDEYFKEI
ncbi:TIGR02221 family CRISPR-associated protein [Fusobacterium pseudoperiodonticum]